MENNYFKNHGRAYGIPAKKIIAFNLTNGSVHRFSSGGEAAKEFGVTSVMVSKITKENRKATNGIYSSTTHTDKGIITFFEGGLPTNDILMVSQVLFNEADISKPVIAVPQSPKSIGRIIESIGADMDDIKGQYVPSLKNQNILYKGQTYLLVKCLFNYSEGKIQSLKY